MLFWWKNTGFSEFTRAFLWEDENISLKLVLFLWLREKVVWLSQIRSFGGRRETERRGRMCFVFVFGLENMRLIWVQVEALSMGNILITQTKILAAPHSKRWLPLWHDSLVRVLKLLVRKSFQSRDCPSVVPSTSCGFYSILIAHKLFPSILGIIEPCNVYF